MSYKSKSEIEEEQKLRERLADEFIYDPETGTKLTLEQAESGQWIPHDNVNRLKSKDEIETYYHGNEQEVEELKNYMKISGWTFERLSDTQLETLEQTKILSKYDDWSYSNSFSFDNGKVFAFFPAVQIKGYRHLSYYHESQIMFWLKEPDLSGHFYLREKTRFESIADVFRNDDDIKLANYESFTFSKSHSMLYVIRILESFKNEKGLEIEILDDNLMVKTLRYPTMEDFLRIEKILNRTARS